MQKCSVMNPMIRRIYKLIRGRKSSAEGMTDWVLNDEQEFAM